MLKKYKLNNHYSLELCSKDDAFALNGLDFDYNPDWVISQNDEYRKLYTTEAAKMFNLPFKHETPKLAIQQILVYANTGKEKNLKKMWFRIVKH